MRTMTQLETRIYKDGHRLIPGVSHGKKEWVRHRNRYEFFKKCILADIPRGLHLLWFRATRPISILDLGCGVGYGSAILATIPNSFVLGIDISSEAIYYASHHYQKRNIEYRVCDIHDFVEDMDEWDYIVAHEVIEHIEDGFVVLSRLRFKKRALICTPYSEPPGRNKHHRLFNITENNYGDFPHKEFFYGDLGGYIYNAEHKLEVPLSLLCVISREYVIRLHPLHVAGQCPFDRYWRLIRNMDEGKVQAWLRYILRRFLPQWAYGSLRSVWRAVRRVAR